MVSNPPIEVDASEKHGVGLVFFCTTGNDDVEELGRGAFALSPEKLRSFISQAEQAANRLEELEEASDDV